MIGKRLMYWVFLELFVVGVQAVASQMVEPEVRSIATMKLFAHENGCVRYEDKACADLIKQVNKRAAASYAASVKKDLYSDTVKRCVDVLRSKIATRSGVTTEQTAQTVARLLDTDIVTFMQHLIENVTCLDCYRLQSQQEVYNAIYLYNQLIPELLGVYQQPDEKLYKALQIACANRLIEWSCCSKSAEQYLACFADARYHPLTYFCSAVIWKACIDDADYWHQGCLSSLKKEADGGKAVVCLAGLDHLYQLLQAGVTRISVVDTGYSAGRFDGADDIEWLVRRSEIDPGIGDKIMLENGKYLIRVAFGIDPHFAPFSMGAASMKRSITEWGLYSQTNERIGTFIFDRRPLVQKDFEYDDNKVFLMSYEALGYALRPVLFKGWNIDLALCDKRLSIYVKQLRKPMTYDMLCAYSLGQMLDYADTAFICCAQKGINKRSFS